MSNHISRKHFIGSSLMAAAGLSIVPSSVLGGSKVAPSDKLSLGFIGTGRLSPYLGTSFLELGNVDIVAAADVYKAKVEAFEDHVADHYKEQTGKNYWAGFRTYHNYEDMLTRDDIDAIVVVTPDHWHAKAAIDAANAGKHIYCEKPLTHTVVEGRKLVNAVDENDVILQTGSMQRSWESFRHACELVRNGYLGEIQKVIVSVTDPAIPYDLEEEPMPEDLDWDRWIGPAPMNVFNSVVAPPVEDQSWPRWRDFKEFGGGTLCDWGAHMFDIAQWALGMDDTGPVELIAPKTPVPKRGLKMIYANGIEMEHYEFGRGHGVEFHGTEGSMQVSREFLQTNPANIATAEIKSSDERLYHSDNHYANWIDGIREHKETICPAEVGHRSASVCNIANIAYWVNRDLKWDPVAERFDDDEANSYLDKEYREGYEV
ncbi:MAG: Gfo/Idh/MocA family oxidoreductase [Balneolaceae bacterium]|nr:Gfo/Idh/MocA family oxidoreductase [Balneolaceae bacterium]